MFRAHGHLHVALQDTARLGVGRVKLMARTDALAAILPTMARTLAFAGAEGGGGAAVFAAGTAASTTAPIMVRTGAFVGTKGRRSTAFARIRPRRRAVDESLMAAGSVLSVIGLVVSLLVYVAWAGHSIALLCFGVVVPVLEYVGTSIK